MATSKASTAANGLLPMPAAILQKQPLNSAPKGPSKRAAAPRLKVVVRRLAPGLTQAEFESALGDEWKLGSSKVDWLVFRSGKVSKDLAKPSRPSRAYLHLTDQRHLAALSDKVRQANFADGKNTSRDPALIGPPSLEFSPYTRIPGGRRRNDVRQGTIDQDPDFQEFLESLTNPIAKHPTVDADIPKQEEKITTTPLIEHLREKKAAKEKPATKATSKHGRHESREARAAEKKAAKAAKEAAQSTEKGKKQTKADRATREAAKVLNREAAGTGAQKQSTEGTSATTSMPSTQRRRERPPVSVATKIQRDLGLIPAATGRSARAAANTNEKQSENTPDKDTSPATETSAQSSTPQAKVPASTKGPKARERRGSKSSLVDKTNVDSTPATKVPTGPSQKTQSQQQQPPKGPAATRTNPSQSTAKQATSQPTSEAPKSQTSSSPQPPPAQPSRQAFLKHANASQGITEALLHAALTPFGAIERLEIDRRKGFAYVDFAEPAALRAAVAASPVPVAAGAVQVLERRDRPPPPPHPHHQGAPAPPHRGAFKGRGAPRGGRGRGGGASPAPTVAPAAGAAGGSGAS